jgi:hypothetical protein
MYHYRYQGRTPNTTSLSRTGDPTVAPSKEVNKTKDTTQKAKINNSKFKKIKKLKIFF